jgi:hypothetical protein
MQQAVLLMIIVVLDCYVLVDNVWKILFILQRLIALNYRLEELVLDLHAAIPMPNATSLELAISLTW